MLVEITRTTPSRAVMVMASTSMAAQPVLIFRVEKMGKVITGIIMLIAIMSFPGVSPVSDIAVFLPGGIVYFMDLDLEGMIMPLKIIPEAHSMLYGIGGKNHLVQLGSHIIMITISLVMKSYGRTHVLYFPHQSVLSGKKLPLTGIRQKMNSMTLLEIM